MEWGVPSQIEGTDGTNAYTVSMPNASHTVPTTTLNNVGFTGSGTNIEVFKAVSYTHLTLPTILLV